MHGRGATETLTPDEALVLRTREGDRAAFAELWRRHYGAGVACARSFTTLDADDLVSEAFTRIYVRTQGGGGPRGAFRPYLYTTIRNLAATWGTRSARTVTTDNFEDAEPTESAEEPVARSLDRTLTVKAYRSLPARWQTVLWYTEIEGLEPHEVAPVLGMSANGVAALAYRAREGLRTAWLQAHVKDATATGECAWVMERLGDHSRRGLTDHQTARLEAHLARCTQCAIVSEEVDEVGSHLAMVLLPLLLGGVAGGTLLSLSGLGAGTATAATSAAGATAASGGVSALGGATAASVPALPAAIGGVTAGSSLLASASSVVAVAASAVFVAAVGAGAITGGTGVLSAPQTAVSAPQDSGGGASGSTQTSASDGDSSEPVADTPGGSGAHPSTGTGSDDEGAAHPASVEPAGGGGTGAVGGAVAGTVDDATDAVDTTVAGTTGLVDSTVDSTTDFVDGVVDTVLPAQQPLTGTVNGAVDGVTDTVDTLTGDVSGVLGTTTGAVTGSVDGLVGGLLGGGHPKG